MGYRFRVKKNAFCVKETREYPWPSADKPDRTLQLFGVDDHGFPDIFTENTDGTVYKQTGLGTFGHVILPEERCPIPEKYLDAEGYVNLEIV